MNDITSSFNLSQENERNEMQQSTMGKLSLILNGTFESFALIIEQHQKDMHELLIKYTAKNDFNDNDLRYLEVLTCIAYLFKQSITVDIAKKLLNVFPEFDGLINKYQPKMESLGHEANQVMKKITDIDVAGLSPVAPLRTLCEASIILLTLSRGYLVENFYGEFDTFLKKYSCFTRLDDAEQYKLFNFEKMMRCVNTIFTKKKLKGNFIALAAASTEGDTITYNTGGASNIRTKCREIIFHAITKIPIIPRPRRSIETRPELYGIDKNNNGGNNGPVGKRRKVDAKIAEIEDLLNETLLKFRANPNPVSVHYARQASQAIAYQRKQQVEGIKIIQADIDAGVGALTGVANVTNTNTNNTNNDFNYSTLIRHGGDIKQSSSASHGSSISPHSLNKNGIEGDSELDHVARASIEEHLMTSPRAKRRQKEAMKALNSPPGHTNNTQQRNGNIRSPESRWNDIFKYPNSNITTNNTVATSALLPVPLSSSEIVQSTMESAAALTNMSMSQEEIGHTMEIKESVTTATAAATSSSSSSSSSSLHAFPTIAVTEASDTFSKMIPTLQTQTQESQEIDVVPAIGSFSQLSQTSLFVDQSQEVKLITQVDPELISNQETTHPVGVSRQDSVNTVTTMHTMSTVGDGLPNLLTQESNWTLSGSQITLQDEDFSNTQSSQQKQ